MPDEQMAAWYVQLGTLTPEELKQAIVETLRTYQYAGFPPVGTVLANAGGVSVQGAPLLAWGAVRDAISRVGAYESPDFGDPVVNAVIRNLGGWPQVCETRTSKMEWLEKRFCETYSAIRSAPLDADATARLPGLTEVANGRMGYTEPIRVAHVRCLTVDTGGDEPVRFGVIPAKEVRKRGLDVAGWGKDP